jgi:serine/threonine-protein kinase
MSADERSKPQPSIETIKAPAPERVFSVGNEVRTGAGGVATVGESPATGPAKRRTALMLGAGLLGVVVLTMVGWFVIGALKQRPTAATTPTTQAGEPAKQTEGPTPPAGMVFVPGGTFMMGSDKGVDEAERPAHQVTVKPFFIDTYEVTNEDYEKFVKAANYHSPATWKNGSFPSGAARKPVTGVTWYDANDFARWAGKRLPTEEEWEFAARGTDGRYYPWLNDSPNPLSTEQEKELVKLRSDRKRLSELYTDENPDIVDIDHKIADFERLLESSQPLANLGGVSNGLVEVGKYKGASPFGVLDMVGNAWEWTASDFRAYPGGRLPANQPSGELKVIRGGSYESTRAYATTTYRTGWPARGAKTYDQTGFRCVKDVQK